MTVFCRADLNKLEFLLQFHMPALDVHGSYRAELANDRQIAEWAKMFSSIREMHATGKLIVLETNGFIFRKLHLAYAPEGNDLRALGPDIRTGQHHGF